MPTAPVSRLAASGRSRVRREPSPLLSEAEESEEYSNSSGAEDEEEDIDGETLSDCSEASDYLTEEEEEVGQAVAPPEVGDAQQEAEEPAVAAPAAAQAAEPAALCTPPPTSTPIRRRWDRHGEEQPGTSGSRGNLLAASASKRSWRRYRYQIVEALFTFNGDRAAAKRYLLFNRGVLVPAAVLKYYYHRHYRKPLWPTASDASPSPPRCWPTSSSRQRRASSKSSKRKSAASRL